jgi:hypothetical protein
MLDHHAILLAPRPLIINGNCGRSDRVVEPAPFSC